MIDDGVYNRNNYDFGDYLPFTIFIIFGTFLWPVGIVIGLLVGFLMIIKFLIELRENK
jgi:hypothetical protein